MATRGPYDSNSLTHFEPQTLGERIKKLRWHLGLTQRGLSEALHTDQAIISNWERDKAKPAGAAIAALAHVFKVSPLALETGEGFSLPEAPQSGPDTQEAILTLPPPGQGPITFIELPQESAQSLAFQEALARLLKATQAGRSVWIVVR